MRFSVLIPAYNAGPFLEGAVRSVLNQTCEDFELIVIDDGSTDGSLEGVRQIGDARIRILSQTNQGAPAATNAGLEVAIGEWIALLDADDLWVPAKLAAHWECILSHPELDLTFDWSRSVDEQGRELNLSSQPWRGSISFEQLLVDFVPGNSSCLVFRRHAAEKVGRLNVNLRHVKDVDLCLRISSLRSGNCRSVPEYLTRHRRHRGQMSRAWSQLQNDWERLLDLVPTYSPQGATLRILLADSNMRRYLSWLATEASDGPNAVRLACSAFLRAPLQAPLDSRNWLVLAAACSRYALPDPYFRKLAGLGQTLFDRSRRSP